MKKDILKLFEEVLKIKQASMRINTINMIADAESIAKQITAGDVNKITTDVRNVGIMLANVIMFDDEDAGLVGVDNVKRLAKALDKSRIQFNEIAVKHLKRLDNMIADLEHDDEPCNGANNNIDDDLTKLTKEELIARLREKSK